MIEELLNNYKTKYDVGFIKSEIDDILNLVKEKYTNFSDIKFKNAMEGVRTVQVIDGNVITYKSDLLLWLKCGIENRDIKLFEFY